MSRWQPKQAKLSKRDAAIKRNNSFAYYGMSQRVEVPKERKARQSATNIDAVHGRDIEAPVIAAVADLLRAHTNILFAVRQNSGALPYDRGGKPVPIWFYKLIRKPCDITIVDYWGFLRDGKPFALECKKPSWEEARTDHEKRQQAFLHMIDSIGGIGSFVRSVDEAQRVLG